MFRPVPRALAQEFAATPVPRDGRSPDAVLDAIAAQVLPYPLGNGHPRFSGWVNSPPAVMGIFADALAAAMNPSVAGGNQAAVYVERQVVAWFAGMLGFPASAAGQLVTGSSAAALTALGVARHVAAARSGVPIRTAGIQHAGTTFTAYQSSQAHSCHRKAFELLGLGSAHVREIETDAALRMEPAALTAALDRDVEAGHTPVAVVASVGTVNTGAIDPLDAIADICDRYDVWLHVDGAYGAPVVLATGYAAVRSGIARAASVAMDPHKWMYAPVEAGLVLIKDAPATRAAYSLVAPYLQTDGDPGGVGGPPWFSEFGLQQTRAFRALKLWATLVHQGVRGYEAAITHTLAMAAHLAAQVRATPALALWTPPGLSIVCFRWIGDGTLAPNVLDVVNRELCAALQLGGVVFPTSTVLAGRTYLRSCILHPGTQPSDVEQLVALAVETGRRIAAARV